MSLLRKGYKTYLRWLYPIRSTPVEYGVWVSITIGVTLGILHEIKASPNKWRINSIKFKVPWSDCCVSMIYFKSKYFEEKWGTVLGGAVKDVPRLNLGMRSIWSRS